MGFDRDKLPPPAEYFESIGHKLTGAGAWRSTRCEFHGGSDSTRVNVKTGGWICMACGAKGGDVLAHHMQLTGDDFATAAKALGAWIDDGKGDAHKTTQLPAKAALEALAHETNLIAVAAGNVGHGVALTDADRSRVITAANRIATVWDAFR